MPAVSLAVEDRIVRLRKTLSKQGLDAGADTIAAHLTADSAVTKVPAVSTIWRILSRRGFITPQPHKATRAVSPGTSAVADLFDRTVAVNDE
jgi:hypothetical protein